MNRARWLVGTLLGLFAGATAAFAPEQAGYSAERITVEHGLPDLRVFTLAEDRDGLIWVGSRGGLFRYDGYRFDLIDDNRPHRFGDRPLIGSSTGRVFVDGRNRVWAMSWGEGLSRIDLDRGEVRHYRPNPAVPGSLSSPFAQLIHEARDGTLWIGTANGLNRYDEAADRFERVVPADAPAQPEPIDPRRVWSLLEAADGSFLIGTVQGLYRYDPARPEQPPTAVEVAGLARQTIRVLHRDARERLWLATADGFGRLDLERGVFEPVPPPADADFSRLRVSDVWPGRGDALWLATEAGVLQLDLAGARYRRWPDGSYRLFPADDIRDVLVDSGGVVWLSSLEQGIVKLRETGEAVRLIDTVPAEVGETHGFGQVNAVAVDREGRAWLATPRGLLRADAGIEHYREAARLFGNPELGLAWSALALGDAGELWLAGQDGVRRLHTADGSSEDFGPRLRQAGALDLRVNAVLQDRQRRTWFGSHRHGLFRLDADGSRLERIGHDPQRADGLSADQVSRLLEDRLGRLWVGTLTGGLNLIVPGDERVIAYRAGPGGLAHDEVSALYHARDGRLWVGGPAGVDVLSLASGQFERVGLPSLAGSGFVADFFEEDSGQVWGVFSDRIARLPAPAEGAGVRRFEDLGGRPFLFRDGASATLADGTRLFGGRAGLLALRPESLRGDAPPARTSIARVLVDNEERRPLPGSDGVRELTLEAGVGSVLVEFALADFRSPRLNQFRYRMGGVDQGFVAVGGERSARFAHLPPGSHLFEVEGSGPEGVWSAQPARLRLRVLPPWWADSRVIGSLLLLLAVAGVLGFRVHLYRVGVRQAALQRVIDSRTRALVRQREDLEAMDQMVRAVNAQVEPRAVLREALTQGLALFPAGVRGSALIREPGERRLTVVSMVGYTIIEQEGRFRDDSLDPERLVEAGQELARGLLLIGGRQQHRGVAGRQSPLASLALLIELEGAVSAALVIDHYGSPLVFDEIDIARLSRYREHLAGALANARLLERLAAGRADATGSGDPLPTQLTDALAAVLAGPLNVTDTAAQELEIGLARLERESPIDSERGRRAAVVALRKHLQALAGGIDPLRSLLRRLRQAGSGRTGSWQRARPVRLLEHALSRLRDRHGAWLAVDSRLGADPELDCQPEALAALFDGLFEQALGALSQAAEPRLAAHARCEDDWLLLEIEHSGGSESPIAREPALALDALLAQVMLGRHGGRLSERHTAAGQHWLIALPLRPVAPPETAASAAAGPNESTEEAR